ncbi:Hypothetical protein FKW44_024552, partial [Caligus rogercresseyi]
QIMNLRKFLSMKQRGYDTIKKGLLTLMSKAKHHSSTWKILKFKKIVFFKMDS